MYRLPEPTALRDKDSAQRQPQSKHPKESQSSSQLQGQQLAEKVQQKLQGDADLRASATAPVDSVILTTRQTGGITRGHMPTLLMSQQVPWMLRMRMLMAA